MNGIKNVLICGIGAVGSIYAQKIQKFSPKDLKILVDEERFTRYSKNPMVFNGKDLVLDYVLPENKDFKADLIIIATKYDGLSDAVKNIKNFVKSDTVILSLLNGVTSESIIAKEYGQDKLLLSYFIGHSAMREGRFITHDGAGKIVFGEKNNKMLSENILKIKELFDRAQVDYEIPEDMDYSRWYKFMINVGTNQASAVLEAPYKLFQTSAPAMDFAKNLMKEALILANLEGVKHTENMLQEAVDTIMTMLPDAQTSMLQDILAKRKTEADIFSGTIIFIN